MGNKYIKHKLMLGLGKVNRKAYEKVRFLLLLKRWPNIKKPQTINEWLLHRKINQIYSNPELSGTIESYQYAQKIDPNINFTFGKAQKRNVDVALSNTFGFGGHNACIIFSKLH